MTERTSDPQGRVETLVMRNEWAEKLNFIAAQKRETVEQTEAGVVGRLMTITCRCGRERGIMLMYRCLYCGEWFCTPCAEHHFGQTVADYRQKHPIPHNTAVSRPAAKEQSDE